MLGRRTPASGGGTEGRSPTAQLKRSALIALALIALEAFVTQGLAAPFMVLWALALLAFGVPLAWYRRPLMKRRAIRGGVLLLAAVIAFLVNEANNGRARRHAEVIVAAVERYRDARGEWPRALEALVPQYLEQVPAAKPGAKFHYLVREDNAPMLMWVELPPFGRGVYRFAEGGGEWGTID
jgi:hypothetical protein